MSLLIIFSVDSFDEYEPVSVDQAIQESWSKRKSQLEHEYPVTVWTLSIFPEICCHVASELTGEHDLMIERVVEQLHVPPC